MSWPPAISTRPCSRSSPRQDRSDVGEAAAGPVGPFKQQGPARREQLQGYEIVLVTCSFEKALLDARIVFDKAGKIAGLNFVPPARRRLRAARLRRRVEVRRDGGDGGRRRVGPARDAGHAERPGLSRCSSSSTLGAERPGRDARPEQAFKDLAWGWRRAASPCSATTSRQQGPRQEDPGRSQARGGDEVKTRRSTTPWPRGAASKTKGSIRSASSYWGTASALPDARIALAPDARRGRFHQPGRPDQAARRHDHPADGVHLRPGRGQPVGRRQEKAQDLKAEVARIKALGDDDRGSTVSSSGPCRPIGSTCAATTRRNGPIGQKRPCCSCRAGRDYQVTPDDLENWKKALGSRPDVEFRLYPKLNHMSSRVKGRSFRSSTCRSTQRRPEVIEDIAAFVLESSIKGVT